jgi:carbonic anhydrase
LTDVAGGAFGVALTCIDGRIADVVHQELRREWGVDFVDVVTVPGPESVVPELPEEHAVWDALRISVQAHGSSRAAVVAHTDCAANAVDLETRRAQVREAVFQVRDLLHGADVTGWLVDTDAGTMEEVA